MQIGTYNLSMYSTTNKFTVTIPLIIPALYYNVQLSSVMMNEFQLSGSVVATFDSGTSIIYTPSLVYSQLTNYIKLFQD
jgi:hypothetical protein